ncbi:MAG TPA: zinc-dependent metalloprotease family protein [Verrucomicrobiae bacterium]|nr:zinc-dependent metalloprotease family protein [Verrucomicrobiae bacterium]
MHKPPFLMRPGELFQAARWFALAFSLVCLGRLTPDAVAQAEAQSVWTRASGDASTNTAERWVSPAKGTLFSRNAGISNAEAAKARAAGPGGSGEVGTEVVLPMPDGTLQRFTVVEVATMEPELAARFPELKTYAGQGVDDPTATVRLNQSPFGLHAQVLSAGGAVYVDPAYRGNTDLHISYYKRDYPMPFPMQCISEPNVQAAEPDSGSPEDAQRTMFGANLRTFRLAVAATGEYTQFFGGTVSNAMAAIVTAINRINGLFEREFAVRLVLVANNHRIIYTSGASDPYSNNNGSAMLAQNQNNLTAEIGAANYDIGHVFSTGGGGIATMRSVCTSTIKARGVTGLPTPTGDAFYIDFVAHEMGHQFGADHTFNAETDGCGGQRAANAAFEPGSGSTIMAYAGICYPNDVQNASDAYFHAGSLDQIRQFLSSVACGTTTATGNGAPVVSTPGSFSIPAQTPFVLEAAASDPNGDALTFCWEQLDAGGYSDNLSDPDLGYNPLFRSLPPTNVPVRYFPKLSSVLANTNWNQERLPGTTRTLTFRVTARDNRAGGGGVADADMQVNVIGFAGPFVVTSPQAAVAWTGEQTVIWDVAGTADSPINASGVNIRLSTDGGQTFAYLLATNVPNTGACVVSLPDVSTSQARIKVEAAGNIFYDISEGDFTVIPQTPVMSVVALNPTVESCVPANGAIDAFESVTAELVLENIGGGPALNLNVSLLTTNGIQALSGVQAYGTVAPGESVARSFTFVAAGACGGVITAVFAVNDGAQSLGVVTQQVVLGQLTLQTNVFSNMDGIVLADGLGSPYPSTIVVSGIEGSVFHATVSVLGLWHTWPSDIDAVLVGPGGQSVKLISDSGGGFEVNGIDLVFHDTGDLLPKTSRIFSGTYRPTDHTGNHPDNFAGNPPEPFGATLAPLLQSPNGAWALHVLDQYEVDGGFIQGWNVTIVTSNLVCCSTIAAPAFTSTTVSNNVIRLNWSAVPGAQYQVQYRTNLTTGSWMNLGAPLSGAGNQLTFTNSTGSDPMRLYRVVIQP